MRYPFEHGAPWPLERRFSSAVKVKEEEEGETKKIIFETPYGELVEKWGKTTGGGGWRLMEHAVKNKEDLKRLRWLFQNTTFHFLPSNFEKGEEFQGDLGEPQFWLPRSPYQTLSLEWMGLENLIYALVDAHQEVEDVMKAIDEAYDSLYEELISYGRIKIINFGENIDAQLLSPAYFEQYLIPFYEKRSNQLRKHGIYTHIHIDGSFKPILKFLKDLPFDGLEALTPLPQGDVSIEEMKEHIGDKILLDGIPAVLFLSTYPEEELMACVEKLVKLFHPRLVLGISDELPQAAGEDRGRVGLALHEARRVVGSGRGRERIGRLRRSRGDPGGLLP